MSFAIEVRSAGRHALRIVITVAVGMMLTAGAVSSVQAKHATRWHAHHIARSTRLLADGTSGNLGPMRYYGGPKSPMWRGPAQN